MFSKRTIPDVKGSLSHASGDIRKLLNSSFWGKEVAHKIRWHGDDHQESQRREKTRGPRTKGWGTPH